MADGIQLPDEGKTYVCSACGFSRAEYFPVFSHINQNKAGCKSAGGRVNTLVTPDSIAKAVDIVIAASEEEDDEEEIGQPSTATSMAEQAAVSNVLPWDSPSDVESEPTQREVTPSVVRDLSYSIRPTVEIASLYDAFRSNGYVGSISEWMTDMCKIAFALSGADVRLISVKPQEREMIARSLGL